MVEISKLSDESHNGHFSGSNERKIDGGDGKQRWFDTATELQWVNIRLDSLICAMNKKKVVLAAPVPLQSVDGNINWDVCCLCQETSSDDLVCPANNPNASQINKGYNTLSVNIERLKGSTHVFPSKRKSEHFDEGCGIKETLIKNRAKWHKKCIVKYTTRFSNILEELTSENGHQEHKTSDVKTRSSSVAINPKEEVCFLCKKESEENQPLHRCMTYEIFNSIKEYAIKANDTETLAFLAEGDLVAQEAKYHSICVLNLRSKGKDLSIQQNNDDASCDSLAFADLLLYMHTQLEELGVNCAFNTANLIQLYNQRLSQLLGKQQPLTNIHNTRFRERILLHFPDLKATKSGREYVLTPQNANIIKNLDVSSDDRDALAVNRFIRNVRKSVFSSEIKFTGSFSENCEESCIPPTLLALVNMLLYGSSILAECRASKPAVSISQLVLANMLKRKPSGNIVRFNQTREPPLPLYIGLSLFSSSRDKLHIDDLHHRGISVSSNRIYQLTADLARFVVKRAAEEGVVCPSVLQKGLFTVAAFDNIDLKTSSTTSQGEFHGSGISLFQLPLNGEVPTPRLYNTTFEEAAQPGSRHVPNLPREYSEVPEFLIKNTQPSPPPYPSDVCRSVTDLAGTEELWYGERDWLDHIHDQLTGNEDLITEMSSWAAYRATHEGVCPLSVSNNSLLPLFHEKSTSPAMVKHALDIVKNTTEFLNPGQIPVICVDQPLLTLMKLLQWSDPDKYGQKNLVVLFGPLHIEQNFLRVLGDLMKGCGWSGIVANSGLLPSGSADGLLKVAFVLIKQANAVLSSVTLVSSITKSRLFHQYTAAVLHSLLKDAYFNDHPDSDVSFETWIAESATRSPTFKFWLLVLRLELLLLKFVRAVREAHYAEFRESIAAMLPWFFSSGHHLYARWLTVHALDLSSLEKNVPETLDSFSALGIDHAHEQNNANIKSAGGAIGLTHDPVALRRWTVAGPEVTRLLSEFEGNQKKQTEKKHHEQYPKFQEQFFESCAALKHSFLQSENPFLVKNNKLLVLDTRVEVSEKGIESLNTAESRGLSMLNEFVVKRLETGEIPFYNPVKKENIQIFALKKSQKNTQVAELKCDLQLFSRLFIVSLARSLDLDIFFDHENQPCPPALALNGNIRTGQKAKLMEILEKVVGDEPPPNTCDGLLLDGAALVRMVKPREGTISFQDFSDQITSYCANLTAKMHCKRVDIIWDQYSETSLKATARDSRGTGARRPGLPQKGTFPKQHRQWEDYLKNDGNKAELFSYLAEMALKYNNVQIVTNVNETIKSNFSSKGSSLHNVSCAGMEEADGRIFLHAKDMVHHGSKSLMIRCSDTDVVVLAVSFFHILHNLGLTELWVHFGVGVNKRFVAAHSIAQKLGEDRSCALRGFHAFTGCDTVSFFSHKGKKSAWAAWDEKDEETTRAFKIIGMPNVNPPDLTLPVMERFVIALYGAKDICDTVKDARQHLFATEGKPLLLIPPTAEALKQHTRRAAYQAGIIWGKSLDKSWDNHPLPSAWGWKSQQGQWVPHWTDREDIWRTCRELSACGCASGCGTRRCSCRRAGVPCALSCKKCKGKCENKKNDDPLPELDEDIDGDLADS
ncbi:hypothetical protein FOCC_FOCC008717 [Frankliniella occidentalis]|nr:hypothetical protein FOCC_FOCC008717 [Frankliniella occidentalis]